MNILNNISSFYNSAEYEDRLSAAEKIQSCFDEGSSTLDLSGTPITSLPDSIGNLAQLQTLNLYRAEITSIPEGIGNLAQLQRLYLRGTPITSLPDSIGNLAQLQRLDLRETPITSLPDSIGNLAQLQTLDLGQTPITSLPEWISNLAQLRMLNLGYTQITSLPDSIGNLAQLQTLYLGRTPITSLPDSIGNLAQLQALGLGHTPITSLPERISNLAQLRVLELEHTQITSLPGSILTLPDYCDILLEGCSLPERVINNLRTITSSPDYRGPRISHSVHEVRVADARTLEDLLDSFYRLAEKPKPNLSTVSENQHLRNWLARLSDTADFKRGGHAQKKLAGKAIEYIELANGHEAFRELFSIIIEEATATCGDRVALSVLHLGIAHRLAAFDLSKTTELADFLVNTVWAIEQLEKIAKNKVDISPFVDEIEVHLGFMVSLKEALGLTIDAQEMLYFRCSNITPEELENAKNEVLAARNDRDQKIEFLIDRDIWKQALRTKYPDRYPDLLRDDDWRDTLKILTEEALATSLSSS